MILTDLSDRDSFNPLFREFYFTSTIFEINLR